MNTKIIPIIMLIIILAIGGIAVSFYQKNTKLNQEKEELTGQVQTLDQQNKSLKRDKDKLEIQNKDISQRLGEAQDELNRTQQEMILEKRKVQELSEERDMLVEKLKSPSSDKIQSVATVEPRMQQDIPEDHWADFVKKKASLEAELDSLNETLLEAKSRIAALDKDNKELSIKIDQLTKEKERITEDLKFKERTLRVMSMDLVSEREERASAVQELTKLRSENVSLKRELVLANKEQMKLQNNLKSAIETKNSLENRMAEAENVLKEKSLAFKELQDELKSAIAGSKRIVSTETASVELPPIVVKPSAPGLRGIRGEIIAVNREERFVVIDLGEASGLRPGMLLKVMRGDREIASVEVIETRKEISAADIKETMGGLTIQEGDIVISR
ncbi:MAG: hypothetical protein JW867_03795 [Candidatus Omnitrophica bacterium]|nr:hypothetical protein [Candidatus Omnitrophota bacterium]